MNSTRKREGSAPDSGAGAQYDYGPWDADVLAEQRAESDRYYMRAVHGIDEQTLGAVRHLFLGEERLQRLVERAAMLGARCSASCSPDSSTLLIYLRMKRARWRRAPPNPLQRGWTFDRLAKLDTVRLAHELVKRKGGRPWSGQVAIFADGGLVVGLMEELWPVRSLTVSADAVKVLTRRQGETTAQC